jgi:hypothetical protein
MMKQGVTIALLRGAIMVSKKCAVQPYFLFTRPLLRENGREPPDERGNFGGECNPIVCSASAVLCRQLPQALRPSTYTKQCVVEKDAVIALRVTQSPT